MRDRKKRENEKVGESEEKLGDNMENRVERRQEKGTGGDLRQRDRGDRKRVLEGT